MSKIIAGALALVAGAIVILVLMTNYTESRATLIHERAMAKALLIQASSQSRLDMLPYALVFSGLLLVAIVAITMIVISNNRVTTETIRPQAQVIERIIERHIVLIVANDGRGQEFTRRQALKKLSASRTIILGE